MKISWFELKERQWIGIGTEELFLTKTGLPKAQLSDRADILDRTIVFVENDGHYELHIAINEKEGAFDVLNKRYVFRHIVDAMSFRKQLLRNFPVTYRLNRDKSWLAFSGRNFFGFVFGALFFGYFIFFSRLRHFNSYKSILIPIWFLVCAIGIYQTQKRWKSYQTNDFYRCTKETTVPLSLKDDDLLDS
jgi:hypothetical protein